MKAYEVTQAVIEQMAFDRPGLEIEFSPRTAYLKTGSTLWFAMLPEVGNVVDDIRAANGSAA